MGQLMCPQQNEQTCCQKQIKWKRDNPDRLACYCLAVNPLREIFHWLINPVNCCQPILFLFLAQHNRFQPVLLCALGNRVEIVMFHLASDLPAAFLANYRGILGNCYVGQFFIGINIFEVQANIVC